MSVSLNSGGILSIFGKKKNLDENYLALVLTPQKIIALIWKFEGEEVKSLGFGGKNFQNLDILTNQVALAIDTAGEQAKVDVTKTVFGLSNYWFEDGSISRETARILKKLSQDLEISPEAFVPLSSGINHLLKIEESITPNAVLVGAFGDFCEVHLLQNNQVIQSKISKNPVNIEKIEKLISLLKEEDKELPSRIIVYGENESSQLAEKISKNNWKNIFIHEPKVDFLDDNELARAVAYAQAADILGYEPETDAQKITPQENPHEQHKVNELGFVEGEDILQKENSTQEAENKVADDKATEHKITQIQEDAKTQEDYALQQKEELIPVPQSREEERFTPAKKPKVSPFSKLKNLFLSVPDFKSSKKVLIVLGILLAGGVLAAFVAGQALTSAEVIIKVNPHPQESTFDVTAQVGGSLDKDKSQISANELAGEAQGSQKAVASGSKKLGDPAKGQITIFNITSTPKTFPKSSVLITKDGLKFSLDDQVEATSAAKPGEPSQTNAKVTSVEVGSQYNLEAGKDLSFGEFDEFAYWAQNTSSFTGGNERQATVVTKEDMDRLEKSLLETVTQKAKDDLKSKAGGARILDDAITIKELSKNFDHKIDDEASLLNLDLKVQASIITFDENELKNLLSQKENDNPENNLEARAENINIQEISSKKGKNKIDLAGKYKVNLIPKLSDDDLKSQIAGKSVKETRSIIKGIADVSDVSISFSPNLPIVGSIPRSKDKIKIRIET